ncbi:MAG: toxin-antitoxin system HicB family antitoxin [Verrucomicrobiales bacterium]|jgi:predicted HicB family RNase H-like nuclease|nr:toxin-antitoxin system HicB family antitoxin [Verrucomicrobiales bacterium]
MNAKDIKKLANQYIKLVEWSDEDHCYVGTCPELFFGGVHGQDEGKVYAELCDAVEDVLETKLKYNDPLPKPKKAGKYSGKFVLRVNPDLHKALAVKAFRQGISLNELCVHALSTEFLPA